MNIKKIQVLIVSQQVLFQRPAVLALSSMEDITVRGITNFSNGVELVVDNSPPDVAILDIDAAADSGLALSRTLKQRLPSIGVIIICSNTDDQQLLQAIKVKASAYLSKDITPEHLVDTIRRVARGEYPINESLTSRPKVAEQVLHQFQELSWRSEIEGFISPLTPREIEVLDYVAQGYLNKQIASALDISEQTIKNHVTSILRKLDANARTEAVVIAVKKNIITLS
jgi:DNA-binding NarL/FixJ family response regulator